MRTLLLVTLGAAALATGGCATVDMERAYEGAAWSGGRGDLDDELNGPGMEILDRWLAETREGRTIVRLGFRDAAEGQVSEDVAHRANIWFRRYADSNCDMRITDEEIRVALVAAARQYQR